MSNRQAFCDADVWIKLCKVGAIELIFDIYDELYMADAVVNEIKTRIPQLYLLGKMKSKKIKEIKKTDFSPEVQRYIEGRISEFEFKYSFVENGEKNLGEIVTAIYAQEMEIPLILSDDSDGKDIIDEHFLIDVVDHYYILKVAIEEGVLTHEKAEEIYNEIEQLADYPKMLDFNQVLDNYNT